MMILPLWSTVKVDALSSFKRYLRWNRPSLLKTCWEAKTGALSNTADIKSLKKDWNHPESSYSRRQNTWFQKLALQWTGNLLKRRPIYRAIYKKSSLFSSLSISHPIFEWVVFLSCDNMILEKISGRSSLNRTFFSSLSISHPIFEWISFPRLWQCCWKK